MALYDFAAPRLFIDVPLGAGFTIPLERAQANYLLNVLRMKAGATVLVFNGRDGEWRADLGIAGRKTVELFVAGQVRAQTAPGDFVYLFAPLKSARLDYMAQKAVEMGASALQPVFTHRTQVTRVNGERLRANVVEAAEQCGILSVPQTRAPQDLASAVTGLEPERHLLFCDEDAPLASPIEALRAVPAAQGFAVLIGPEGGFAEEERALVGARPNTTRLSLGPRILRADTAAVAVLALAQAVLGDWR